MKPLLKILFFIIVNLSLTATAQKIDTAPLDAYWKMIEPLKQGDSLSKATWANFLEIEANQVYVKNQGFDAAYLERVRKNIEYVYMPKYDSLLKTRLAAIAKDSTAYWNTYKVYVYKANEVALKKYEKQLLEPAYIDSIYKNVWYWLPERLRKKDTSVVIHFLGIENDAIAGSGNVIATLWSAYNQDKLKKGILGGHEMQHVLRKPVVFENVMESDKGLLYALRSILNEGTADMIDKPYAIANDNRLPIGCRYKDFVLFQADSIVKQLNLNIAEMSGSKGKTYKTEKEYRNLIRWTSGHCPGYYMADIIVRNGFRKKMLKNIQNPFYFIYLYNKAAKKDRQKPAVFSDTSIAYIESLEKKYWVK